MSHRSTRQQARCRKWTERFAAARRLGPVRDWEQNHLPPPGTPWRRELLLRQIKIDLDSTWREHGRAFIENYVRRFAEVSPPPLELIVAEYDARVSAGAAPPLEEYRARFPDEFAQISDSVRGRSAIEAAASVPPAELVPAGYKLIAPIGRAAGNETWRAEAPGGIDVAIRFFTRPLGSADTRREVDALDRVKRLRHTSLVATLACWVIRNHLVVALELTDEGSLRDRLTACQQQGLPGIPRSELLKYFRQAAEGIDWLHDQPDPVMHLGINPDVLMLRTERIKLAEFGLARGAPGGGPLVSVTVATGTYAAPEQLGGKAGPASDRYSLALTYVELLTGRRPTGCGADLGQLPAPERSVIRRALAVRPEDRFATCVAFIEALEDAAAQPDVAGTPSAEPARSSLALPAGPAPAPAPDAARRLDPFDWIVPMLVAEAGLVFAFALLRGLMTL